ncbi:MAG TPA: peptidoglycan recognition family protein [Micromonosporaceae bacterium]
MTSDKTSRRTLLAGAAGLAMAAAVPFLGGRARADASTAGYVSQPTIDSCADWGARPPAGGISVVPNRPNKIIVHHTVSPNTTDYSRAQAHAHAHWVQDLHIDSNRWPDTGYHFINSRGGWLTEGRHGSLYALMRNNGNTIVQGAHTSGQNDQAIGIANEGSYHDGAQPTQEQWNSLITICAFVCQQYAIPPSQIYGHKDFGSTLCPGVIHDRLPELRQAVAARLA